MVYGGKKDESRERKEKKDYIMNVARHQPRLLRLASKNGNKKKIK
jgi:hypothetical protein